MSTIDRSDLRQSSAETVRELVRADRISIVLSRNRSDERRRAPERVKLSMNDTEVDDSVYTHGPALIDRSLRSHGIGNNRLAEKQNGAMERDEKVTYAGVRG